MSADAQAWGILTLRQCREADRLVGGRNGVALAGGHMPSSGLAWPTCTGTPARSPGPSQVWLPRAQNHRSGREL